MDISESAMRRTELLVGKDALHDLGELRVIIFGVGGVGCVGIIPELVLLTIYIVNIVLLIRSKKNM